MDEWIDARTHARTHARIRGVFGLHSERRIRRPRVIHVISTCSAHRMYVPGAPHPTYISTLPARLHIHVRLSYNRDARSVGRPRVPTHRLAKNSPAQGEWHLALAQRWGYVEKYGTIGLYGSGVNLIASYLMTSHLILSFLIAPDRTPFALHRTPSHRTPWQAAFWGHDHLIPYLVKDCRVGLNRKDCEGVGARGLVL